MKKATSTTVLLAMIAQLGAPLAATPALAESNPFGKKRLMVGCAPATGSNAAAPKSVGAKMPTPKALASGSKPGTAAAPSYNVPTRPTPLMPPAETEVLVCAAEPSLVPGTAAVDDANLPKFHRLVRDYVTAYYADNRSQANLYAGKIKIETFKNPGSPEYVEDLRYLDSQAAHAPEAIYDIAKNIQLHWEALYAMGMSKRDIDELNPKPIQDRGKDSGERTATVGELKKQAEASAVKIGAIVGIAILGASLVIKPSGTPRYFNLFRHLAPLAGVALGAAAGQALTASGYYEKDLPVSPASVMTLGIASEELAYDDHSLERDLAALTISMASFSIAMKVIQGARAIKYVNAAATPAKINPIVLVASIAVSLAVEQGVEASAEAWEFSNLKEHQSNAKRALDAAIARGDDYETYLQAQALMKRTVNLAAFVNLPLTEAMRDFVTGREAIGQQYAADSASYREAMDTLTRETSYKIRMQLENSEADSDPDRDTALVLSTLRNPENTGVALLPEHARAQAQVYLGQFPAWFAQAEGERGATLSLHDRGRLFQKFVDDLASAYDTRLAQELRAGHVRRDANHIMLQAAGYLVATGKSFVSDQSDFLRALIARNERMVAVLMSDAASVAGIANQDQTMMDGGLPPGGVPTPSTRPHPQNHADDELDGGAAP